MEGTMHGGEYRYTVMDDGKVKCEVTGGESYGPHSTVDWLWATDSWRSGGRALAWVIHKAYLDDEGTLDGVYIFDIKVVTGPALALIKPPVVGPLRFEDSLNPTITGIVQVPASSFVRFRPTGIIAEIGRLCFMVNGTQVIVPKAFLSYFFSEMANQSRTHATLLTINNQCRHWLNKNAPALNSHRILTEVLPFLYHYDLDRYSRIYEQLNTKANLWNWVFGGTPLESKLPVERYNAAISGKEHVPWFWRPGQGRLVMAIAGFLALAYKGGPRMVEFVKSFIQSIRKRSAAEPNPRSASRGLSLQNVSASDAMPVVAPKRITYGHIRWGLFDAVKRTLTSWWQWIKDRCNYFKTVVSPHVDPHVEQIRVFTSRTLEPTREILEPRIVKAKEITSRAVAGAKAKISTATIEAKMGWRMSLAVADWAIKSGPILAEQGCWEHRLQHNPYWMECVISSVDQGHWLANIEKWRNRDFQFCKAGHIISDSPKILNPDFVGKAGSLGAANVSGKGTAARLQAMKNLSVPYWAKVLQNITWTKVLWAASITGLGGYLGYKLVRAIQSFWASWGEPDRPPNRFKHHDFDDLPVTDDPTKSKSTDPPSSVEYPTGKSDHEPSVIDRVKEELSETRTVAVDTAADLGKFPSAEETLEIMTGDSLGTPVVATAKPVIALPVPSNLRYVKDVKEVKSKIKWGFTIMHLWENQRKWCEFYHSSGGEFPPAILDDTPERIEDGMMMIMGLPALPITRTVSPTDMAKRLPKAAGGKHVELERHPYLMQEKESTGLYIIGPTFGLIPLVPRLDAYSLEQAIWKRIAIHVSDPLKKDDTFWLDNTARLINLLPLLTIAEPVTLVTNEWTSKLTATDGKPIALCIQPGPKGFHDLRCFRSTGNLWAKWNSRHTPTSQSNHLKGARTLASYGWNQDSRDIANLGTFMDDLYSHRLSATRNAFVKKEGYYKLGADVTPRLINGWQNWANALFGPHLWLSSTVLSYYWHPKTPICYASHTTIEDISGWVNRYMRSFGNFLGCNLDCTKFSSTLTTDVLDFINGYHSFRGAPASLNALFLYEKAFGMKISNRNGSVKCRLPVNGTDGAPDTTERNTVVSVCMWALATTYIRKFGCDGKFAVQKERMYSCVEPSMAGGACDICPLLVLGDDVYGFLPDSFGDPAHIANAMTLIYAFFGFSLKAKVTLYGPSIRYREPIEFCSRLLYPGVINRDTGMEEFKFGPKVGKSLQRLGVTLSVPQQPPPVIMRANILGAKSSMTHVPLLREYAERILAVTSKYTSVEAAIDPHKFASLREDIYTAKTLEWVVNHYELTGTETQLLLDGIRTMELDSVLPYTEILLKMRAIDNG
jgi:hypothetical protein